MRDDPGIDLGLIEACLREHYGVRARSIRFLPVGYDAQAAAYEVVGGDGSVSFLKIRWGGAGAAGLQVARALVDAGVPDILGPLRTQTGALSCLLDGRAEGHHRVMLFPFIRGESAMTAGLTDAQWRAFGATLRRVHDSGLAASFRHLVRVEDFGLPAAALVRRLAAEVERARFSDAVADRFAAFWRESRERIERVLERAEGLGRSLQGRAFDLVLCHADIHAANILVGEDGRIWLVDWDGPVVAPRERDLLFVVGSRIARAVEPREEDLFFAGYGPVEVEREALVYYRYERIIEDLGEFGKSVLLDPALSREARQDAADLARGFFAPGGDLERVERVARWRWPGG